MRTRRTALQAGLAWFVLTNSALAGSSYELRDLYRDTRMKAMGGAGIALSLEDRDAIQGVFTNPAQMAGNDSVTLHYAVGDIGASIDTYTSIGDVSSAMSNFTFESLNSLMGKNIYLDAQYVGAITGPNFGVAALSDAQVAFYGQNQAYPEFNIAAQVTNGVQAAFGTAIDMRGPRRRRPRQGRQEKRPNLGGEMRVGLGGKMLWRKGGYKDLPLSTLMAADLAQLTALMGSYEVGYGWDLGTQYVHQASESFQWSLASSYQNVGDLDFKRYTADTLQGNWTLGGAAKWSLGGFTSFAVAYDYAWAHEEIDWRKKTHLGLEWVLPGISIYGGLNQMNVCYGASFDAWIFRVTAASYAEELGGFYDQTSNRRYLVRLAMRLAL